MEQPQELQKIKQTNSLKYHPLSSSLKSRSHELPH
jgi:hypothetical protein